MAHVIHKFVLPMAYTIGVAMPEDAMLLHVGYQSDRLDTPSCDQLCLWALVDPDKPNTQRRLAVFPTGIELDASVEREAMYVGTVIAPDHTVWHVFDYGEVYHSRACEKA